MSKGDELVKYITERVVDYIETPKEERRSRNKPKEPWSSKWFGMIPLGISLWWGKFPVKSTRREQGAVSEAEK